MNKKNKVEPSKKAEVLSTDDLKAVRGALSNATPVDNTPLWPGELSDTDFPSRPPHL